jgi:hypothetical protein
MIVEILRRLFALLFSVPELRTRFEAEPEAVLAEVGLGECEIDELADALPLAVAELPPEQATYIIERCGPPESWSGQTATEVLCRVAQDAPAEPSWIDTSATTSEPEGDEAPDVVEVPQTADAETPTSDEPPVPDPETPTTDEPTPPDLESNPAAEPSLPVAVEPTLPPTPAVEPAPPGGGEVQPPDAPESGFVDFKSAVRAARDAIDARDQQALYVAIKSVEPGARDELANGLRDELLDAGVAPDDPLVEVLTDEILEADDTPTTADDDPADRGLDEEDSAAASDVGDDEPPATVEDALEPVDRLVFGAPRPGTVVVAGIIFELDPPPDPGVGEDASSVAPEAADDGPFGAPESTAGTPDSSFDD